MGSHTVQSLIKWNGASEGNTENPIIQSKRATTKGARPIRVCSSDALPDWAVSIAWHNRTDAVFVVDAGAGISLATVFAKSACSWIIGAISDKQSGYEKIDHCCWWWQRHGEEEEEEEEEEKNLVSCPVHITAEGSDCSLPLLTEISLLTPREAIKSWLLMQKVCD